MKDLISTETYGAQKIIIKCNMQLIRKNVCSFHWPALQQDSLCLKKIKSKTSRINLNFANFCPLRNTFILCILKTELKISSSTK